VFRINPSDKFKRSYKELLKRYYKGEKAKKSFQDCIAQIVKNLSNDPFIPNSFAEGWPGSLRKPEEWNSENITLICLVYGVLQAREELCTWSIALKV
jgi:hypothetical protein